MNSLDIEAAIIGSLLIEPSRFADCEISATDFLSEQHAQIYSEIQSMVLARDPVDVITVSERMENATGSKWMAIVGRIAMQGIQGRDLGYFSRLARSYAAQRKALEVAEWLTENYSQENAVDETIQKLMALSRTSSKHEHTLVDAMGSALNDIDAALQSGGLVGVDTGIGDLNNCLGGFHKSDLIVIGARPSVGKAQPISSRVLLANGEWRSMRDIGLADELASIDGGRSIVTGIYPQGTRSIFRVTLSDGRVVEADEEHIWSVESCRWSGQKNVTTVELKKLISMTRYKNRVRFPVHSGKFGIDKDLLGVDPWLIGFLLGDGCLTHGGVVFSNPEPYIHEKIMNKSNLKIKKKSLKGCDYIIYSGKGKPHPIREGLIKLGLIGKLAHQKAIPESVFISSREVRRDVLSGILESDGWVEKNGSIQFSSSSEELACGVMRLAHSLGGYASKRLKKNPEYTYKGMVLNGRDAHLLTIAMSDIREFINSPRLLKNLKSRKRSCSPMILSVEYDSQEKAQCIRVSHDSRLYITDGYVVTHNTAFALNIADRCGVPCGLISGEQASNQIGLRMMAISGRVSAHNMRRAKLDDGEWAKMTNALAKAKAKRMWIYDKPGPDIGDVARQARKWKHQNDIKILFVDYLQRIRGPKGTKKDNGRIEEVAEVARSLKDIARELDIPVVALAQVNRDVEKRADKRPTMSDLANSGEIEREADQIITLYRDEVHNPESQHSGICEASVVKNRHGPTGIIRLAWSKDFMRFDGLERDHGNHNERG